MMIIIIIIIIISIMSVTLLAETLNVASHLVAQRCAPRWLRTQKILMRRATFLGALSIRSSSYPQFP